MDDANPFAAQQSLLRGRLLGMIGTLPPPLRVDVEIALQAPGKLLSESLSPERPSTSSRPVGMWSLLTLLVAQTIDPRLDRATALQAAIAIECLICALDILDDIEDDDHTPTLSLLGKDRALNVATTLLLASYAALLSHEEPAPVSHLQTLTFSVLEAAAGQHLDLLAHQRPGVPLTDSRCLEIAVLKAGSLMALACRMGALCAGAEDRICNDFAHLGTLLGIAHQLDNDAHDLYQNLRETNADSTKSDIVRRQTLPFALAAQNRLQKSTECADTTTRTDEPETLSQGVLECWGLALLYRERAYMQMKTLTEQGLMSAPLRLLLGWSEQE